MKEKMYFVHFLACKTYLCYSRKLKPSSFVPRTLFEARKTYQTVWSGNVFWKKGRTCASKTSFLLWRYIRGEFFTKEEKANVDLKGSFLFTLKVLIFKSRGFTLKFLNQKKAFVIILYVTLKLTGNLTALSCSNSAFDRTNCKYINKL